VRKDRSTVYKVEIPVFKWQVRDGRSRRTMECRTQILLAPVYAFCTYVRTPYLT